MTYLLIESVKEQHSGIYTCISPEINTTKSVRIDVRGQKDFLNCILSVCEVTETYV